jgi:hypothetical protein
MMSLTTPTFELLRFNKNGTPMAAALMIPGVSVVPTALVADPNNDQRMFPQHMHMLFQDEATHKCFVGTRANELRIGDKTSGDPNHCTPNPRPNG